MIFSVAATAQSSITIPRTWAEQAAKDLLRYDNCREENALLKKSNSNLSGLYNKEKEFTTLLQNRNSELEETLRSCYSRNDLLLKDYKGLNDQHQKDLKKQKQKRRANLGKVAAFAGGAAMGFVAGIIYSAVR